MCKVLCRCRRIQEPNPALHSARQLRIDQKRHIQTIGGRLMAVSFSLVDTVYCGIFQLGAGARNEDRKAFKLC